MKRQQESLGFVNMKQKRPIRIVSTCQRDNLAPGWVRNKYCLSSWPLSCLCIGKISQKTPKAFMSVTRERLAGGLGCRSVWEKQEASRNPWKVPQTAHAATKSLSHNKKSVGDLGLVQCDSRVAEKRGDIFSIRACSKCTTRPSPPIFKPLTSTGVRACKHSVLDHQSQDSQ